MDPARLIGVRMRAAAGCAIVFLGAAMMVSRPIADSSPPPALPSPAGAAKETPSPECAGPEYRRFDFWAGDWDAYEVGAVGADTKPVARTRVDVILGGCALREVYERSRTDSSARASRSTTPRESSGTRPG